MFVPNLMSGLLIGLPIMLAVGPIAILLVDQGLERGTRSALPAALGVASADLTFSVIAAIGGTSIALFLTPITPALSMAAVALLLFLAVRLFRTATSELRVLRAVPAEYSTVGGSDRASHAGSARGTGSTSLLDPEPATADIPFGHLVGARLGAAFFGLTVVNPLTVVLFAAVVVAGGSGAGTPGWAVGMGLSSLIVHGGWVLLGGALGSTLGERATARMRLGASVLMAALAVHFLMG